MIWTNKTIDNSSIGIEYRSENFLMFFGNKFGSPEKLRTAYPNLEFRFLKQIHGIECLESTDKELVADAHFTGQPRLALCIRTADCTPILAANKISVLAIHAGWKGTLNGIFPNSLKQCFPSPPQDLTVAFGPHIQKQSFQVDLDLGNKFALQHGNHHVSTQASVPNKAYVDLNGILIQQLKNSPIGIQQCWSSPEDTLTNPDFFSHRADPSQMGRNISFVTRL